MKKIRLLLLVCVGLGFQWSVCVNHLFSNSQTNEDFVNEFNAFVEDNRACLERIDENFADISSKNKESVKNQLEKIHGVLTILQTTSSVPEILESAKIILFCILAAGVYGICQDTWSYHRCPEYFESPAVPHHYKVYEGMTQSWPKNVRVLFYGFFYTWWVGGLLGLGLAGVSQLGSWQKLKVKDAIFPTLAGMLLLGLRCAIKALTSASEIRNMQSYRDDPVGVVNGVVFNDLLPFEQVAAVHNVAYGTGVKVGLCVIACMLLKRFYRNREYKQCLNQCVQLLKSAQNTDV